MGAGISPTYMYNATDGTKGMPPREERGPFARGLLVLFHSSNLGIQAITTSLSIPYSALYPVSQPKYNALLDNSSDAIVQHVLQHGGWTSL